MRKHNYYKNLILLILLTALFSSLLQGELHKDAMLSRLNAGTVTSDEFRQLYMTQEEVQKMKRVDSSDRGRAAGIYFLQGEFLKGRKLDHAEKRWEKRPAWEEYESMCNAIWNDVEYFPVPESSRHKSYTVDFADSWMGERTYGGRRGHEGTDIMASENTPGLYPVVSMSDGTVASKGWLEKGGWRIGIAAPSGGYYYYAHLASYADIEEGDKVRAGEVIGFMGNSGYGPEGTTGMFATHLHVGIYIYPGGVETSVNPYWVLRFLEEKKLSCSF